MTDLDLGAAVIATGEGRGLSVDQVSWRCSKM
jgi:hypothetical protein